MARYWRDGDTFELCDDFGNVLVTMSGRQLLTLLASHGAQAQLTVELAGKLALTRDLFPRRRLLGQHKPLKGQASLFKQLKRREGPH